MRSGFVSIIGRPNTGKSTLLNALTGEKVAIVTNKPQTTRTRVRGIVDVQAKKGKHDAAQIVFVDTPGVHLPGSQLGRRMMREVAEALEQRDIVLLMVDATRRIVWHELPGNTRPSKEEVHSPEPAVEHAAQSPQVSEDAFVFSLLRKLDCPVFLVINKIDLIAKDKLLPLIDGLSRLHAFAEIIPVSARKKDGLERLLAKLIEYLPQGKRYFPKDQFTDQPERFLVAELIRERILMETGEEVPYASAVVVERFEEPEHGAKNGVTRIAAAIYCERAGQKAILIGKGGAKLKEIGSSARREIESLLGRRVYLELHVVVEERWRESTRFLDSLTWQRQLEDLAASQEGSVAEPGKRKR